MHGPEKFHEWRILILMPHNEEKDVGSTDGMKLSVLTSDLIEVQYFPINLPLFEILKI